MSGRVVGLPLLFIALAGNAPAQLISIQTVPFASGDQFELFPSQSAGMGGASIALADPLLDPFRIPARGGRLARARFFAAPTFYGVSHQAGGGRTLPLGALLPMGSWFGGLAFALQEVLPARQADLIAFRGVLPPLPSGQGVTPGGVSDQPHGNAFAFATLGKVLPGSRVSLAGSALLAGLSAIDGVDQAYPGSDHVRQLGHRIDARLAVLKEWRAESGGGRSLEALVLYDRLAMTHDVTYLDFIWDPGLQRPIQQPRVIRHRDLGHTWGLHLQYERPLAPSWRVGWIATVNRATHPQVPDFEILGIPQDPGRATAYNVGLGVSKSQGAATFALDAIFEPIRSTTWAPAAVPVATCDGDTIPVGARTTRNDFRFANAILRTGVTHDVPLGPLGRAAAVQLGLAVRAVRYHLTQADYVQLTRRAVNEGWLEWTPTWGLALRFPELEIRYRGRLTAGTERPDGGGIPPIFVTGDVGPFGIWTLPSSPLTLRRVSVVTHQFSVSLPLR